MPFDPDRIAELLQPYIAGSHSADVDWPRVYGQLAVYLDLLLKWNSRVNLTAIRSPEEIVRRHFGESLFAGLHLQCSTWNIARADAVSTASSNAPSTPTGCDSLLDFGSGAGFPGLPIQILRPELPVTLAEARQKKASFLREVVRSLGLETEVWADRVEKMPGKRRFSAVTMRAVDEMEAAVLSAAVRAQSQLLILGTRGATYPALAEAFTGPELTPIPLSDGGVLMVYRQPDPLVGT
jgi:16S rRNA (guanine527-N7)-methyltransferase